MARPFFMGRNYFSHRIFKYWIFVGKNFWQKGIFLGKKVNSPIGIGFLIILWEKIREVEENKRFLRKIFPMEIVIFSILWEKIREVEEI